MTSSRAACGLAPSCMPYPSTLGEAATAGNWSGNLSFRSRITGLSADVHCPVQAVASKLDGRGGQFTMDFEEVGMKDDQTRLESWKEIAAYLQRDARTAR